MTFGLSCRCAVDGVRSEAVMGVPGGEERPYRGCRAGSAGLQDIPGATAI